VTVSPLGTTGFRDDTFRERAGVTNADLGNEDGRKSRPVVSDGPTGEPDLTPGKSSSILSEVRGPEDTGGVEGRR
jgi:hypothetical protein